MQNKRTTRKFEMRYLRSESLVFYGVLCYNNIFYLAHLFIPVWARVCVRCTCVRVRGRGRAVHLKYIKMSFVVTNTAKSNSRQIFMFFRGIVVCYAAGFRLFGLFVHGNWVLDFQDGRRLLRLPN